MVVVELRHPHPPKLKWTLMKSCESLINAFMMNLERLVDASCLTVAVRKMLMMLSTRWFCCNRLPRVVLSKVANNLVPLLRAMLLRQNPRPLPDLKAFVVQVMGNTFQLYHCKLNPLLAMDLVILYTGRTDTTVTLEWAPCSGQGKSFCMPVYDTHSIYT